MREILFRGKRVDNGEWVYGSLLSCDIIIQTDKIFSNGIANADGSVDIKFGGWFGVSSETVGQYTGLTDKNGKNIFEGDIILSSISGFSYAVEWSERRARFTGNNERINCEFGFDSKDTRSLRNIEVIGNVHDNPELVKGSE